MQDRLKPFRPENPDIQFPISASLPGYLSAEECRRALDHCHQLQQTPGRVYQVKRPDEGQGQLVVGQPIAEDIRRADTARIEVSPETEWLYERVYSAARSFNDNLWQFDISSSERIEYISYPAGSYFNWHYDVAETGPAAHRKLLAIAHLSEEDAYEGGELELFCGADSFYASKAQGNIIVFPTYIFHRVKPVISGCREVLVCVFLSDKPFR